MTKFAVISEDGLRAAFYDESVHGARMRPVYGPVPDPTEDNPNPSAPIIGEEPNPDCAIPASAIEITDELWQEFIDNQFTRKWVNGKLVEYTPPPPPPVIPDIISSRQFFLQLATAGLSSQVEGWVATQSPLVQIAFNKSATFRRDDEMLQQGFAGLGFTKEQVEQFFVAAAGL